MRIDPKGTQRFYSLTDLLTEQAKATALRCIAVQRTAAQALTAVGRQRDQALAAVSPEALDKILSAGTDVHGISAEPEISDVIAFNTHQVDDAIDSEVIAEIRQQLDDEMTGILRAAFPGGNRMRTAVSGHFWYPRGSHMAWHTNNRAPGWRAYLTHSSEPGRSFFRYRDPSSGEIVTSLDNEWDLRVFRVDPAAPFWHAVYSDTDRFSFGYILFEKSPLRSLLGRIKVMVTGAARTVD